MTGGPTVDRSARGVAYGLAAYGLWGAFPLYWPLLKPAGAVEILAHRFIWSLVVVVVALALVRRVSGLADIARSPRLRLLFAAAGALIALNWGTYIYGVNHDRVVEASLGYFITPLLSVLMGVVVLGERLERAQVLAVAIAAAGVVWLTWDYGHAPWIALVLGFSFAVYGLIKKRADAGALETLGFETAVLTPLAVAYLAWLWVVEGGTFPGEGLGHSALLIGAGVVTIVPLALFGAAATRVRLSTLGLLQYVAPTLQFLIGVLVLGEPLSATQLGGFACVWIALALFTADGLRRHRQRVAALT